MSLALHGAFLLALGILLYRPARYEVKTGRAATELVLVAAQPVAESTQPTLPAAVTAPAAPAAELSPATPTTPPPSTALPILKEPRPIASVRATTPTLPASTASSHPASHPPAAVISAGAVAIPAVAAHNAPPTYPEASRLAREEGRVLLRVAVTAAGGAARVVILRTSGYARLDNAACQAVQHWRFAPATLAGVPIASHTDVPVWFRLER